MKYLVHSSLPEMKKLRNLTSFPVFNLSWSKKQSISFQNAQPIGNYKYINGNYTYPPYSMTEIQSLETEFKFKVDLGCELILLPIGLVFTVRKNGHWSKGISIYGTKKDNPSFNLGQFHASIPVHNQHYPFEVEEV